MSAYVKIGFGVHVTNCNTTTTQTNLKQCTSNNSHQQNRQKHTQRSASPTNTRNQLAHTTSNIPDYTPIHTEKVVKLGLLNYILWPKHTHHHQHTQYRTTNSQNPHQQNNQPYTHLTLWYSYTDEFIINNSFHLTLNTDTATNTTHIHHHLSFHLYCQHFTTTQLTKLRPLAHHFNHLSFTLFNIFSYITYS